MPDQMTLPTTALPAAPVIANDTQRSLAAAIAAGLRATADLVATNPHLADDYRYAVRRVTVFLLDPERIGAHIRAGLAAGATVDKDHDDDYARVNLRFGPVALCLLASREAVCERVVVGTREVTEQVPDPDALAAVRTVTVTRTEDIVEWHCGPLLARTSAELAS